MNEPKFKIGQRVWCFESNNYATGTVRSVAFKDIFDSSCTKFEYNILLDFYCDLANNSIWVYDEEQITAEPLTSKEAKRLKARLALGRMWDAVSTEAAYIASLQKDLNEKKEEHLRLEHKSDVLEETLRQLEGKKK